MSTEMGIDLDSPRSSPRQGPQLFRQPTLVQDIPSLAVDYDELDASDPDPELNWFQSLAVFGFSERNADDPRSKALAKLKLLTASHEIGDLKLIDYYRAFLVHSATITTIEKRRPSNSKKCQNFASKSAPDLSGLSSRKSLPSSAPPRPAPPKSPRSKSAWYRGWGRRYQTPGPSSAPVELREQEARFSIGEERSSTISDEIDSASVAANSASSSSDDDPTIVTADHVRLVYHMLRHAESIYGLPITIASAPLVSLRKLSGQGIVAHRNDISDEDIIHSRFTASTFMPANYVAVDRSINAIVVCVRGTANLLDSLTDVAATYDPLRVRKMCQDTGEISDEELVEGYGHYGVLRSARSLFEEIRDPTLVALRANPTFELLITGHSLGGAISAVLSLIMRDDVDFPHALAVCIAPPPCLSWALAEETMTTAITVVNGTDIIPRLSIPVLLPFLATARYVADLPPARRAVIGWGLPSLAVEWDEVVEACENRLVKMREIHAGKELFIPGACFHLQRKKPKSFWTSNRDQVEMVATGRKTFCGIKGREKGMFTAHAPLSYRAKLKEVLRTMKAPKYGKAKNSRRSKAAFLRLLTTGPKNENNGSSDLDSEGGDTSNSNSGSRTPGPSFRRQGSQESVDDVVKDLFRRAVSQRGGTYAALDSPRKDGRRTSAEFHSGDAG